MDELYTEDELWASIEAGERKLAMARQRRRRGQKWAIGLAILFLLIIPLGVVVGMVAGRAPRAPLFVLTWPRPKVQQVVAPGQILLGREGQPWEVGVTNAENWTTTWRIGNDEASGSSTVWSPGAMPGQVTAFCRPIVNDWTSNLSFLWPTREITLSSVVAKPVSSYGRELQTDNNGVWIYPHIFAAGHVVWDERALPLLASAIHEMPDNALSSDLATVGTAPTESLWRIVSDFEGNSDKPAPTGTFAVLHGTNLRDVVPPLATRILKTSPTVSLKFIIRLDTNPEEAIFLLNYDGKKARKAWIRNPGESAGAPFTGWETGELGEPTAGDLPPATPQG